MVLNPAVLMIQVLEQSCGLQQPKSTESLLSPRQPHPYLIRHSALPVLNTF